jgi:hypothetical protein
VVHVAHTGGMGNAYKILVRYLGAHGRKMDLIEIGRESVDWCHLV